MSIHVTRAPTVPLTLYDTKRSSHLKYHFSNTRLILLMGLVVTELSLPSTLSGGKHHKLFRLTNIR